MPLLFKFMACSPSRSSKRSSKKSSCKPADGFIRNALRRLIGKSALAGYSAVAAVASAAYVPQLEQARSWAIDTASHWVTSYQPVRDVQHWLHQVQGKLVDWREALEDVAQQSRDAAHPQASGSVSHSQASTTKHPGKDDSSFTQCAEQLPASAPLALAQVGASWLPVALCSDGFAVLYSGLSKTPIVTIERLNRKRLQSAAGRERTDKFYADARLRSTYKADLADYQGSGYDRGHMAAAANQSTESGMAQSFALSNMVPQDPTNNRKVWSKLEGDVRKYAKRANGNVYVYTGPLFDQRAHTIGRNQVWVPSHLFKLVFDEQQQRAWAWVLPNDDSAQLGQPMSYASFVERTGRNFLPQLH
ncbi:MAG: DNA/RNA non-specific endonuclease [Comamonas sp.]